MKDEVRKLRKKVRMLKVQQSSSPQPGASGTTQDMELCNGHTVASLEAAVSHLSRRGGKDLLEVLKILALKVFTVQELVGHSPTGKKTCKSGDAVRPPLDLIQFQQLESLVRRKCDVSHMTFMSKLQNLQKMLRKKHA